MLLFALAPVAQAACSQGCPLSLQDGQGCCPPDYTPPVVLERPAKPAVALPLARVSGPVLDRHGYTLLALPPGPLLMGGPGDDERVHGVEITRAVAMGQTEVTRGLYRAVMGAAPGDPAPDELPVTDVSWYDALRFCDALSEAEGLQSAYTIDGAEVARVAGSDGYRLPTEAEWEYAARSGAAQVFAGTDDPAALCDFADVAPGGACQDRHEGIAPAGDYLPTPWGLYDLSGNAAEWVWDWYGPYGDEPSDPAGPERGALKVIRGGSWWLPDDYARAARRYWAPPDQADPSLGFRLARDLPAEP